MQSGCTGRREGVRVCSRYEDGLDHACASRPACEVQGRVSTEPRRCPWRGARVEQDLGDLCLVVHGGPVKARHPIRLRGVGVGSVPQ